MVVAADGGTSLAPHNPRVLVSVTVKRTPVYMQWWQGVYAGVLADR
ncbi:hypothetical protein [Rhodococcus erythropolis]